MSVVADRLSSEIRFRKGSACYAAVLCVLTCSQMTQCNASSSCYMRLLLLLAARCLPSRLLVEASIALFRYCRSQTCKWLFCLG